MIKWAGQIGSHREVRGRKPHTCDLCTSKIDKDGRQLVWTVRDHKGALAQMRAHYGCAWLVAPSWGRYHDGPVYGDAVEDLWREDDEAFLVRLATLDDSEERARITEWLMEVEK